MEIHYTAFLRLYLLYVSGTFLGPLQILQISPFGLQVMGRDKGWLSGAIMQRVHIVLLWHYTGEQDFCAPPHPTNIFVSEQLAQFLVLT